MSGCVVFANDANVPVTSVTEARATILAYAVGELGPHQLDPDNREHLRLRSQGGAPTWDDLTACEVGRSYDPAEPDAAMTCSYLLYLQGGLGGVGGMIWTFGVQIWATAPPKVWDHPADIAVGVDDDDNRCIAPASSAAPST